jgi:hypothetical protein
MSRYDIALGKKSKKKSQSSFQGTVQFTGTQETKAPKSLNFSMTGPGGSRIFIPINNLRVNLIGTVLTISNGVDIDIRMTGSLAHQMYEDFCSQRTVLEDRYANRPRSGRTLIS